MTFNLAPLGPNTSLCSFAWGAPSDVPVAEVIAAVGSTSTSIGANTPADLPTIAAAGQRAVLPIVTMLFQPGSVALYDDWQARLDALWSACAPYQGIIEGLYIFDGPFAANAQAGAAALPVGQVQANLNAVADYIHEKCPGVLTFGWFTARELFMPGFWSEMFPTHVDVISSTYYRANSDYTDAFERFIVAQMVANKQPTQKIVLILDAYLTTEDPATLAAADDDRVAGIRLAKELALTSPDIIGVAVFLWSPPGDARGSGALPKTSAEIALYYAGLKGWASCQGGNLVGTATSPMPAAEIIGAPACQAQQEGSAQVYRDVDGSVISSTANAYPTPAPQGSVFVAGDLPAQHGVPIGVVLTSEFADSAEFSLDSGATEFQLAPNEVSPLTPGVTATFQVTLAGPGGTTVFDWNFPVTP